MRLQQLREMAIGSKYEGESYWHVTTEEAARQIAKDGFLKAKEASFEKGSWKPRPGHVYLTNDPGQIAYYLTVRWKKGGKPQRMGIVRIASSIVRDLIEPDEDEVNEIFHSATLAYMMPGEKESSQEYKKALWFMEFLPKEMQKRALGLLQKDHNPEHERRRGAWLRFVKEAIPMFKNTPAWDELLKISRSGSVLGPIPVSAVWIVDTNKQPEQGWYEIEKRLRQQEKIL